MKYFLISSNYQWCYSKFTAMYPYHLVLAQTLYDDDKAKDAIKMQQLYPDKDYYKVILDNGAYEGAEIPLQKYINLAKELKPWCVVLPDLVDTKPEISRDFALEAAAAIAKDRPDQLLMYVPQGRNQREVLGEFQWALLTEWEAVGLKRPIIGIGKCYLHWGHGESARQQMLKEISQLTRFKDFQFHMLGARSVDYTPYIAEYPNLLGIDTFKPMRNAYAEQYVTMNRLEHLTQQPIDDWRVANHVYDFCMNYHAEMPAVLEKFMQKKG